MFGIFFKEKQEIKSPILMFITEMTKNFNKDIAK